MLILIDYDNIPAKVRMRGLNYLFEKIIIKLSKLVEFKRAEFRIYGGWHYETYLSRYAEKIISEVDSINPSLILTSLNKKVIINVTMAYSVISNPHFLLHYTYRKNKQIKKLHCKSPEEVGCTNKYCNLDIVHQFITNKGCARSDCSIKLTDVLTKNEQKLVDSMICSDLIYASIIERKKLCIVSADDDFYPAILTVLACNIELIHIKSFKTSDKYCICKQYSDKLYMELFL